MLRALSLLIAIACFSATLMLAACGSPAALQPVPERAAGYLFHDVAVLDPVADAVTPPQDVLVIDGEIVEVGRIDPARIPRGVAEIDGTGQVLMPGLIDMHVHVFDEADLAADLVHGVTTVRNLSGFPAHLSMAARIEAGTLLGPRLVTTGPIINERGGRHVNVLHVEVAGAEEARAEVRHQYARGFRHIKVYTDLSADTLGGVVEAARALGMSVSGHPAEGNPAEPVDFAVTLEAGFATIEHTESIVWHGLQDDTDPDRARQLAREMAAAGATVAPTLVVHENLTRIGETGGAHLTRPDMAGYNPVAAGFEADTFAYWSSYTEGGRRRMQTFYEIFTGEMHRAGVRLVVGTDAGVMATPHGVSVLREMELLVEAGLTPAEALRAATVNPADVLGMGDALGRVAAGYRADLVLVAADPRADFQVLRHPTGVMRGGVWLDRERLEALREASHRPSGLKTWRRLLVHLLRR